MLSFYKRLRLTNKLSLLTLLVVLNSFVILGWYFDDFLKKSHAETTKERIVHAYERIVSDMKEIEGQLKTGIAFVQSDESMLASINLINNYQDKLHYNAILLDEEKKRMSKELLKRVKLSLNHEIALYDKNRELIAYVYKRPKGYYLNFISYEEGKKVLYGKYENDEFYTKGEFQEEELISFKHVNFYGQNDPIQNAIITYHLLGHKIFLKSHQNIFLDDSNVSLAHVEMGYIFGEAYFKELSKNFDMTIATSKEKIGKTACSRLMEGDIAEGLNIQQTDEAYLAVKSMHTNETDFFIVIHVEKELLYKALNKNREHFFVILLILTMTVLFVFRALFNRALASPLDLLMRQIAKIEKRDYSWSRALHTGDELETISKNMNALASTIHSREADLERSQENLEYLSTHDSLTDLYNRRFFSMRLEHALTLAKRTQTKLVIFFLDLDDFKQVNDSLGHDIGDELLVAVSQRLRESQRETDTLARIGGDEFNILIENVRDTAEIKKIAEKIVKDFRDHFVCRGHEIKTTMSIGIAIYPDDAQDSVELIKNADMALYKAKKAGRNRLSFYSHELSVQMQEHVMWSQALSSAVEGCREFSLVYQPKIALKTGRTVAVEALIRWESVIFGFVLPDKFISLAEETNLIIPLGEWVLKQACSDFMKLKSEGYGLEYISINISTIQLLHSDLRSTLDRVIKETGIKPHEIELEITESYIVTNKAKALKTLQSFRDMGISLAIDDFGTGYSSLSYLQKLPVTRLKIDKSFVDDLPQSQESVAIVQAIIVLAKLFKLAITAEGVESKEQLDFLASAQCDEVQGYIYSKPLPLLELKNLCDSRG